MLVIILTLATIVIMFFIFIIFCSLKLSNQGDKDVKQAYRPKSPEQCNRWFIRRVK